MIQGVLLVAAVAINAYGYRQQFEKGALMTNVCKRPAGRVKNFYRQNRNIILSYVAMLVLLAP